MILLHQHLDPTQYYWGIPTSNIDWCEANYIKSPYIAEFYNTISSLIISLYAFYGLLLTNYNVGYNQFHLEVVKSLGFKTRLNLAFWALAVVGFGSAAFHATLLYQYQLLDELPMIITSLIMLYILVTIGEDSHKSHFSGGILGNSLLRHVLPYLLTAYGVLVGITITLIRDQPKILQISYGFLVIYIIGHSFFILNKQKSTQVSSPDQYLYIYAFISFLVGFLFWIVERHFCSNGYVFVGIQLHALWHVFTGLGVFVWTQFLISNLLEAKNYSVSLNHFLGIPTVFASNKLN
eukprot:gene2948-3679_t